MGGTYYNDSGFNICEIQLFGWFTTMVNIKYGMKTEIKKEKRRILRGQFC
jgi:hypothetical protein